MENSSCVLYRFNHKMGVALFVHKYFIGKTIFCTVMRRLNRYSVYTWVNPRVVSGYQFVQFTEQCFNIVTKAVFEFPHEFPT